MSSLITNPLVPNSATTNRVGPLFGRVWSLALGSPAQNFDGTTHQYTSIRVKFDVDKNTFGSSNKAKFEIYNLTTQNRQAIKKGYLLRFQAGYSGLLRTLFIGAVIPNGIKVRRDGPNIVTELECGDGEQAITFAVYDNSYPSGTTLVKILGDLATQMGIGVGSVIGIPAATYNNGYTVQGKISDTLSTICKSNGLKWYVLNGNLNITPIKGSNQAVAQQLSSKTGLISVPSTDGNFTRFTSLLNPIIVPDSLVNLSSSNTALNGIYRVNRAHYRGDTHDSMWQVECEALPFPNAGVNLPAAQGFNFNTSVVA